MPRSPDTSPPAARSRKTGAGAPGFAPEAMGSPVKFTAVITIEAEVANAIEAEGRKRLIERSFAQVLGAFANADIELELVGGPSAAPPPDRRPTH